MDKEMKQYFELINMIDDIALYKEQPTDEDLLLIETKAKEYNIIVVDFADANCSIYVNTWYDVIMDFKKQFETGERVSI